jgi:hypothetical protein
MVLVFVSSEGRYFSDSVVNSHEVGVLRDLGDDFTRAHPLSLTCYRGDRYEALFGGGVHPVSDLVEILCEVPYRESFTETSAPFISLPVAHVGCFCCRWFNLQVHWQTTCLLRYLRSTDQVGFLKVLASHQQP